MKKKLFILAVIAASFTMPAKAQTQNTIPDKKVVAPPNVTHKIFQVLSIAFVTDSSNTHGTTRDTYITETITYLGTGVVNYTNYETQFSANTRQYPNGILNTTSNGSMTLSGTGTDIIKMKKSAFVHSSHSLKIVTTTPNQVTSNTVGY
jgi:hypothetical protein